MKIYNYNPERAEKALKHNDERVKFERSLSRTAYIIKSCALAIMCTSVLAMLVCAIAVAVLYSGKTSLYIALAMFGITVVLGGCVFVLIRKHHHPQETTDDYFDDLETRYHRMLGAYKSVKIELTADNKVLCVCEDADCFIECKELKPRCVKVAQKLTQPTLDVSSSCLWLPKSYVSTC